MRTMHIARVDGGLALQKAVGIVRAYPSIWRGTVVDVGCRTRELETALNGRRLRYSSTFWNTPMTSIAASPSCAGWRASMSSSLCRTPMSCAPVSDTCAERPSPRNTDCPQLDPRTGTAGSSRLTRRVRSYGKRDASTAGRWRTSGFCSGRRRIASHAPYAVGRTSCARRIWYCSSPAGEATAAGVGCGTRPSVATRMAGRVRGALRASWPLAAVRTPSVRAAAGARRTVACPRVTAA